MGIPFEGFDTISPDHYFHHIYNKSHLILITCADVEGVKNTIASYQCDAESVACDLTSINLDESGSWFDYIWEHIDDFSEAYELLCDQKSKEIFIGLLNYRISRDPKYIDGLVDGVEYQYFEPDLFDVKNFVMADCGAYVGDTIENFVRITEGMYKKIYTFEPDKEIFKKLTDNINKNKWKNVEAYNIGNYNKKDSLRFESPGTGTEMSNHISDKGNIIVEVDSLDNIIEGKIDLIKMDIEGAEYDALLGSRRLIEQYHPILAICIYHLQDDYYRIIKLIHELNPNYKLYIRQYAYNDNETIVYAV